MIAEKSEKLKETEDAKEALRAGYEEKLAEMEEELEAK